MPDLGRYLAHRSFAQNQSYRCRDIAQASLKFRMSHFFLLKDSKWDLDIVLH